MSWLKALQELHNLFGSSAFTVGDIGRKDTEVFLRVVRELGIGSTNYIGQRGQLGTSLSNLARREVRIPNGKFILESPANHPQNGNPARYRFI